MNQQSEHLSNAQIENYGDRSSSEEPEQDQHDEEQWVEAHLADCSSCRSRVLDFQRTHLFRNSELAGPGTGDRMVPDLKPGNPNPRDPRLPADAQANTASTPDCPNKEDIRLLAAGLCSDATATRLTQHAASCDHCGALLRGFVEDFSDDFSPEEQAMLDQLASNSEAWQIKTAREMARSGAVGAVETHTAPAGVAEAQPAAERAVAKSRGKPFFWRWLLIPATAACVIIVTMAARRDTPEKVELLLAQAYTEPRRLAMRFPNTPFAPMHVTRGPEQSRLSQSRSLLKAEGIIGKHLQEVQENIGWLQARAKADILDGRPGAAITVLSQALAKYPDSVPLVMNLAVAHFELAATSNDAQGYEKAQELLTSALNREPGNCVALFNRAVVLGRLRRVEQARSDWNATLRCESDPAWAAEAHDNLEALTDAGADR